MREEDNGLEKPVSKQACFQFCDRIISPVNSVSRKPNLRRTVYCGMAGLLRKKLLMAVSLGLWSLG